ncbi:MAG: hypothetical protein WCR02_06845 [Sphaerochaetaceae bacterium]
MKSGEAVGTFIITEGGDDQLGVTACLSGSRFGVRGLDGLSCPMPLGRFSSRGKEQYWTLI